MNQPNTTAWSKAVCTATSNFFTCRTPCSCGWKTPCFSCNTDHLNIAFSNMFPDTGLARLPQCQSGIWKIIGNNSLQRLTWTVGSGNNYGDVCLSSLNSNGLTAQGWVVTGSDACTEDNQTCTVDNVRCYAVRLN